MSIVSVIAGAYVGSYNGTPIGYTRRGYNVNFQQKEERIEETDIAGGCLIDKINQGAQITIDTIARIWSSASGGAQTSGAFWPWQAGLGVVYSTSFPIAQSARNVAKSLVLTVVANTPAALTTGGISTLTAALTIITADQQQIVLSSQARDAPLRFDLLLNDSAGTGSLLLTT